MLFFYGLATLESFNDAFSLTRTTTTLYRSKTRLSTSSDPFSRRN